MNHKYEKHLYIAEPQATSHIWTEESVVHYLDFTAGEIRVRRAQLIKLTAQDRALVIMDQAGDVGKVAPEKENTWVCRFPVFS